MQTGNQQAAALFQRSCDTLRAMGGVQVEIDFAPFLQAARLLYEGPWVAERHSVVQFCHPTPWTVLAPLPSCCTPEHPPRYAGIEAGAMLDEVLWQINLIAE